MDKCDDINFINKHSIDFPIDQIFVLGLHADECILILGSNLIMILRVIEYFVVHQIEILGKAKAIDSKFFYHYFFKLNLLDVV